MSVDPSALSLRVSPELLRQEIFLLDGADYARATMIVHDVFFRRDVLEHFESLGLQERSRFLAEVHDLADYCPRRWPVDVGTAGLPARLLDADQTIRVLAEVFEFLESRCYFAAELGYYCVDDRGGHHVPMTEKLAERLGLAAPGADSMQTLLQAAGAERLGESVAIAREFVGRPPERSYHSFCDCGWHPSPGMFSIEQGRRYFDDILECLASGSILGPSLRPERTISRAQRSKELVVDPLRRTATSGAPPEAYLPHGSVLTLIHLVDHLRLLGRHDLALLLAEAHRLEVEADGPATNPRFTLVVETPAESWAPLEVERATVLAVLEDLSASSWSMTWRPPPIYRRGGLTVTLSTDEARRALASSGVDAPAGIGFRVRPRPGGETQLVVLVDDVRGQESSALGDAVFKAFDYKVRTAQALGAAAGPLRELLQPAPVSIEQRRPRVAVIIPNSEHMQADILPALSGVCDVTTRSFFANAVDAGQRLAQLLRDIVADRDTDAVLVARGGGSSEQLEALCTDEVKRAVAALADASKLVVVAIGHGTFRANIGATFEAKVPNAAARVLRAMLVDHPQRLRALAAESQARLAALRVDENFAEELAAEAQSLRDRIRRATEDHEQELQRDRQPEV